jgi:WD40 repeat protein
MAKKSLPLAEHGCSENGACGITTILVSPDKQQIFTASFGSEANVWDRQGNLLFQLNGHEGSIVDAEYSADGSRLVTGSTDQTAMLWDAQTGEQIAVFQGHTKPCERRLYDRELHRHCFGRWESRYLETRDWNQ